MSVQPSESFGALQAVVDDLFEDKPDEHTVRRLDAIVAKLYNLSREQSLKLFVEGKVFLDGINMTGNARSLKEGEVVSVRGYGKFIFNGEGGNTKKDKLYIKVSKYV